MRRFWPLMLLAAGLFVLISGFVYDLMCAGIPYQDPTPEMSANYAWHFHIATTIGLIGLGVFAAGLLAVILRLVMRLFRSPVAS